MSKGLLATLMSLLIVLVASGMLVSAADAAVPGDWMYGVDRAVDDLRLRLALDSRQKAQVELQLAQERLHEAQMLALRGDTNSVELLRLESRLAMQAAKILPHATRKAVKPAAKIDTTAQAGQAEAPLDPYCAKSAAKRHPAAEKLAQRLAVGYSEIMTWHCQGLAFGEIAQTYRISRSAGWPVEELFAIP